MTYILADLVLLAAMLFAMRVVRRRLEAVDDTYERVAQSCDRRLQDVEDAVSVLSVMHRHRIESLESKVKNHDKAAGGFHLCRDKSLVRVRDLTDAQLRHVLHEVQGLEAAAVQSGRLRDEVERRLRADVHRQSEDVLDRMRASVALAQVESVSKTLGLRKRQILLQSLEVLRKWGEKK